MRKNDIIQKLLSPLNSKLTALEKTTKEHLKTIQATSINIEYITATCITIQNNIKNNQCKEAQLRLKKPQQISSVNNNHTKFRSKTPLKSRNTSQGRLSKLPTKDNMTTRSNNSKLISRNSYQKSVPGFTLTQIKRTIHHHTQCQLYNSNVKAFQYFRNSKGSLTSKTLNHFSNGICSIKKLPSKIKNSLKKGKAAVQNKSLDETNISKIISFDPKNMFDKDDPLLIGPISDIDLISLPIEVDKNTNKDCVVSNWINQCAAVEEFYEDYLPLISEYLKKKDLIRLMLVNKNYAKQIKQLLIKSIQKEKMYYELRLLHLDSTNNTNNNHHLKERDTIDMSKFHFSKRSIKAVSLLNESLLNKLFIENNIPSDDILIIYYIYFQLICHELSQESNKTIFWEKCCKYFSAATQGQTGNLIQTDLLTKIILTSDNITNILNIIKDNTENITPSYFSKICGTTGLIVFFIKDVLDYIGISNDKKCQSSQSNLTYKVIINLLEMKIQKISHMSNYYNDHLLSN